MDNDSFIKRAGRYAKVSGSMGKLAMTLAGNKYLGMDIDKGDHAEELKNALGNLRGPLMKVAQLLATIPDALPPEYAREFQQLQSKAPPMGWPFVKRRMAAELGRDWRKSFAQFDRNASAAASLGQVHRAKMPDGQEVACKLQYPDMSSAVEADLKQLKLIFNIFERYDQAVSTKYIHAELADRLKEELDYALEAKRCTLYHQMLADEGQVHVPQVVDDVSTDRLLTATWLDGQPILDFKDADQEVRNQIAMNLFRAWYVPLYYYGVIHGDPHLGNYSVRDDYSINLLDFGCVRVFGPHFIKGVIDLYYALLNDDRDLAVHAYETWGFTDLTDEVIDILSIWARFLYAPILEDTVRPIGERDHGVYGREKAAEVHEKLRNAGGVTVPREFVFMDRAALGLGSVFLHLDARINWHTLFNELIADFDVDALKQRQNDALTAAELAD
jgi:predicted unusual protein kinase regulating ubiquinone biosynthesis (AarF/ABC1/UbiB family)